MSPARADSRKKFDPALWRPVALKDGDPRTFAYLRIEEASDSEVVATVYRWPRIDLEGRLELKPHCSLRAKPIKQSTRRFRGARQLVEMKRGLHLPSRTPLAAGDLVAGSPVTDQFWEETADLEDWHRFSPPLIRITEEAQEVECARFQPLAWTLWRDWLGQAPLIAHYARLAAQQLSLVTGAPAQIAIEARVGDDTEHYFSPDDYLSLATPKALEKPDSVVVVAGDERLRVRVSVARHQDRERDWLTNAVLLEVESNDPKQIDGVARIHERMEAALKRGEPRWWAKGSTTSVSGFRPLDEDGPREIPQAWRDQAQRRASRLLLAAVGILGGLIGALANVGWIAILILGVCYGLFVGGVLALLPGVEFTARRSERMTRFAVKGLVAPLIGAVAATAIRFVSEGGI
ncbi:MAG TPA: hypothetical protein VFS26_07000 [Solirubrobacterales bacterium]|nr:hypothetical protein [Solirubrobacterales bacterium]